MIVGVCNNSCQFFGNFPRVAVGVVVVGRLPSLRTWAGPCRAGVVGRNRPSPNGTASGAAGVSGTCCFVLYRCPVLTSACNPASGYIQSFMNSFAASVVGSLSA